MWRGARRGVQQAENIAGGVDSYLDELLRKQCRRQRRRERAGRPSLRYIPSRGDDAFVLLLRPLWILMGLINHRPLETHPFLLVKRKPSKLGLINKIFSPAMART